MRQLKHIALVILSILLFSSAQYPLVAQQGTPPVPSPGPYQVGVQIIDFTDKSRDDRKLQTYIWYPAHTSKAGPFPAPPDTSGAPYPLVIYSHGWTATPGDEVSSGFINHLVSQGFVVAAVDHHDQGERWPPIHNFVDRPLDILFVLDELSKLKDGPLVGMLNTENVGVFGYSLGGYTTVSVAGARIDLAHLTSWCSGRPTHSLFDYCGFIPKWDQMVKYRDSRVPPSNDDLWTATTDKRIRAIFAMAPCGGQFWGERGLATVSVPVFIVAGTADLSCPYDIDAAYIYDHLGTVDHYLVTLDGGSHADVPDRKLIEYYETAFFGYYILKKTEYTKFLTIDSANAFAKATLKAHVEGH
jgi:predicted dienelactone hydrolase